LLSAGDPPLDFDKPSGRCVAGGPTTIATPDQFDLTRGSRFPGGEAELECEVLTGFLEVGTNIDDRRFLPVGTYSLPIPKPSLHLTSKICGTGAMTGRAAFDITRADGGPEPYPEAVSPDYVREFSLHVEVDVQETRTSDCFVPSLTMTEDLQFTETAADTDTDEQATCGCL
jgi:hypothetical protein